MGDPAILALTLEGETAIVDRGVLVKSEELEKDEEGTISEVVEDEVRIKGFEGFALSLCLLEEFSLRTLNSVGVLEPLKLQPAAIKDKQKLQF